MHLKCFSAQHGVHQGCNPSGKNTKAVGFSTSDKKRWCFKLSLSWKRGSELPDSVPSSKEAVPSRDKLFQTSMSSRKESRYIYICIECIGGGGGGIDFHM